MLSQAKVKWAKEYLDKHPNANRFPWKSKYGIMVHSWNDTECCGLLELAGWSPSEGHYNDFNKALFYRTLAQLDEALVYATTISDQIYAEAFLKEAGFKPAARGKSWKTDNVITLWTLAIRSPRARGKDN